MNINDYTKIVKPLVRRKQKHEESSLQIACVRWFRMQFPFLKLLLFSVPNGGQRDKVTAMVMRAEGTVAGVADLLLLYPSAGFHGLCIEMKTEKGVQRDTQKKWQQAVEEYGYKYIICRSIEQFMVEVDSYLKGYGTSRK